jgi:hypothetical protein
MMPLEALAHSTVKVTVLKASLALVEHVDSICLVFLNRCNGSLEHGSGLLSYHYYPALIAAVITAILVPATAAVMMDERRHDSAATEHSSPLASRERTREATKRSRHPPSAFLARARSSSSRPPSENHNIRISQANDQMGGKHARPILFDQEMATPGNKP